ncbi:MAG: prepilin-type N-terminal cleavage/methylation domain-containing protein [Planctomycetota bacterium]
MMLKAFTLVELLVVISIIALLIAILLPALGKAMVSSQDMQCLSNTRGIAVAMQIYTDEQKEQFPAHRSASLGADAWGWNDKLLDFGYLADENVFRCPRVPYWESNRNPGTIIEVAVTSRAGLDFIPYGYNSFWMGYDPYAGSNHPTGRNYTKRSDVKSPSNLMLVSDSQISLNDTWATSMWYPNRRADIFEGVSDVHDGMSNISFADGHSEPMDADEVNGITNDALAVQEAKKFWIPNIEWDPGY